MIVQLLVNILLSIMKEGVKKYHTHQYFCGSLSPFDRLMEYILTDSVLLSDSVSPSSNFFPTQLVTNKRLNPSRSMPHPTASLSKGNSQRHTYARAFVEVVLRLHGLPEVNIFHQDRRFASKSWTRLFDMLGTDLLFRMAWRCARLPKCKNVNGLGRVHKVMR